VVRRPPILKHAQKSMTDTFDVFADLLSRRKALTVTEVSDLLSVSKQAVYEHVKRGSLPALQLGSTIRLNPRDVARWLASRRTVPLETARAA
jgi:excisionase family DNA binding protein